MNFRELQERAALANSTKWDATMIADPATTAGQQLRLVVAWSIVAARQLEELAKLNLELVERLARMEDEVAQLKRELN